jgi:DNA replication protein DnaC
MRRCAGARRRTRCNPERLREQLKRLRLLKSRERLDALLQEAAAKDLSYADFLDQVLSEEVTAKAEKNITMRTSLARFRS